MATASIPLPPFVLRYPIGHGGTATVWYGEHATLGQPVAVKIMASRYGGARGGLFAREVRAVARLDHPGIIRVHDHGRLDATVAAAVERAPGTPYLVMAWCGDGTLASRCGRMPWERVRAVLLDMLDALARAHAVGVVHRDLKPSNILLDGHRPVIADFGLGFERDAVDDAARVTSGTPGYMAPEQIDGRWRHFGPQTDLYALGCTAWALVAGRSPFTARDAEGTRRRHLSHQPAAFAPRIAVPPAFEGWLRGLMALDPRARPRFAAHAAEALRMMPATVHGATPSLVGAPHDADVMPTPDATPTATPTLDDVTPTPIIEHPPVVASSTPEETPRLPDCGRSLAELREPHLRGRRAERQLLWQALLDVCAAGRPAAVVIEGSAGMGKSRLAEWLTRRAHQAGRAETLRATHQPDPGAASGVGPMLVRHLRLGGLDGPARGRRLAGLGHGSDTAALLAALDPDGVAEVDGRRVQLSRADARAPILVRAIERMAAACPHIFVVDDAHWGPGAVDIAHRLLDRGRAPLLLVLTCRRHRLATLERLTERAEVQRLRLDPLPAEAIGAIAEDRVLLDPGVRRRLVEHVGGNPSFASEMVRHWLESDLLVPGPAGHGLRSDAALIVEPTALWSARLARAVADGSRRAPFCIAAALGLEVDEGEWRAVCARAGAAVVEADVEALFDASLARPSSDGQWAFVHAGLRSALLEQAVDLPAIHQHCAAVLSARTGVDTRRIAAHLEAAGDLEAAFDSWLHAWRITRRRAAADEGRRCLLAAARICRRLGESADGVRFTEVRVWWALMASNTGAVSLAQRHADRALRDARRRGDGPQITRALMLAGQTRANTDSAASIALLREAHARSASLEPDLASTCARWLCDQLLFTGDPVGARRILDDATRRARAAGDASALAYVALRRAELASLDGDLDGAERAAVEARAAFEASGDRFGLAHAGMVRGLVARDEGRYADAVAAFESARDTFRRMGHHNIAVAECNLSQVLLADGRVDAARAAAERGRAAAIEMRNDVYRVMAEMSLLPTLAQAGDAGAWDGCWAALVTLVPQVGLALVDAGEALADAGRRAELNGWSARAGRARAMAIAQFEGAGCPERAAALRLSTR